MLRSLRMNGFFLVGFGLVGAVSCGDTDGGARADGSGVDAGGGEGDKPLCGLADGNSKGDATTGTVTGKITAEASAKLSAGDLFIAVLPEFNPGESCPGQGMPPKPVANVLARCVDLGDGAYSYTVEGIPPRAAPYYVIPFLDVNGNVDVNDPKNAGPDACDLISMGVTVVVDTAGERVVADEIALGSAEILVAFCRIPGCM